MTRLFGNDGKQQGTRFGRRSEEELARLKPLARVKLPKTLLPAETKAQPPVQAKPVPAVQTKAIPPVQAKPAPVIQAKAPAPVQVTAPPSAQITAPPPVEPAPVVKVAAPAPVMRAEPAPVIRAEPAPVIKAKAPPVAVRKAAPASASKFVPLAPAAVAQRPQASRRTGMAVMSMAAAAAVIVGYIAMGGSALQHFTLNADAASIRAVLPSFDRQLPDVAALLTPAAAPVSMTAAPGANVPPPGAPLGEPPATPPGADAPAAPETDYIPDPPPSDADAKYQVQAVMVAKTSAVLSSAIDGRIVDFPFRSGDLFNKGDTLATFDCGVDHGRMQEVVARARLTEAQLKAYQQLSKLKTISKIELDTAVANHAQNLAQIEQVNQRLNLCKITAPFDGLVTHRMVNPYEFVQTGRVLLDIASREPLQSEFLVPSVWLRWLNVGTPLTVYIEEAGRRYDAKLTRISGEVDPVSQSVQVTAELSAYHEELRPGMSGRATFSVGGQDPAARFGYHGLILQPPLPPPPPALPPKPVKTVKPLKNKK